jgi:hypothetical protein
MALVLAFDNSRPRTTHGIQPSSFEESYVLRQLATLMQKPPEYIERLSELACDAIFEHDASAHRDRARTLRAERVARRSAVRSASGR